MSPSLRRSLRDRCHPAGWLALLLFHLGGAAAAQSARVHFAVPAQPMDQALILFALEAGVSVGDGGLDLQQRQSPALNGDFPPAEALQRLLAGSGLVAVWVDPQTAQVTKLPVTLRLRTVAAPLWAGERPVDTVVVTATKRRAVAQALPDAIVVLDGARVADGGSVSNQIAQQGMGLDATNLGAGQDRLFIRGLADSVITGRSQSTVGLYWNDSRVTDDAPDPGLRLVDIDKLEVLRGPQGTLYGAGTLGGLVRVVTRSPVMDRPEAMLDGAASLTLSGTPSYSTDAMVNLPLIKDTLALRLVAYGVHDGGYIDAVRRGQSDVNHTGTLGGRLALRWVDGADWVATLGVIGQQIQAADQQYAFAGLAPLAQENYIAEPRLARAHRLRRRGGGV